LRQPVATGASSCRRQISEPLAPPASSIQNWATKLHGNSFLNGASVLSDFDIFAEAGAKGKAVVKDFSKIAPGPVGYIRIGFQKGSEDSAKIDGIEVLPSGS
jgi:hypothetical protein